MAQIHLIGGEKGGVGKSLVARLLAQYMIDREIPFIGFDTDRSHGALLRFYAGYAAPVQIDRYEMLDHVIEAAVEQPERRVLVDLAAQTHEPLQRWIDESGVLEVAAETGIGLTYWHVMDNGRDSVDLLARLLEAFGDKVRHVLVRNQLRGDDFRLLDGSAALAHALSLGARAITIRHLNDAVMQKIDASSSSFWAASQAADKETTGLGMMDRQRVKVWLRDTYAGFDSVESDRRDAAMADLTAFPTLATERLLLREIVAADAPALHAILGDPDVMRWYGSDRLESLDAARSLITSFAGWRELVNPGTRWGLQLRDQPALVGSCGLFGWNRQWRKCSVGYELAPSLQGRGLMDEALRAVLAWGFAKMALHRIEALIHPDNLPSIRLVRRLGFAEEGRLREVGRWGGRQHDMLLFAVLRREWHKVAASR